MLGKKKKQFFKKIETKAKSEETVKNVNEGHVLSEDRQLNSRIEQSTGKQAQVLVECDSKRPLVHTKPSSKQVNQHFNVTQLLKDTKTLFVQSSRLNRVDSNKSLRECLVLFDKLYGNNRVVTTNANKFRDLNMQVENIDLDFDVENMTLGIFGNRKSTLRLIRHEIGISEDKSWLFDILTGNIAHLMEAQTKTSNLNDFYFTVYQLATKNASVKYLSTFCDQLLKNGDYHKAACII